MTPRASRKGGADSRCPSCSAPLITQWVGNTLALKVSTDGTPLTPAEQTALRTPNRLIWCLTTGPHRAPRLRWIHTAHPTNCPHPHVTEHQCTAPPTTLF
ncbi:hypothetical protein ACFVDT_07135 [Streptomyces sp. NPDC057699]|uniref:hypothetical protein n=1 Tax=Streptomyces sp. NPDC057699 TaxID=3346220 RepID=UPI003695C32E